MEPTAPFIPLKKHVLKVYGLTLGIRCQLFDRVIFSSIATEKTRKSVSRMFLMIFNSYEYFELFNIFLGGTIYMMLYVSSELKHPEFVGCYMCVQNYQKRLRKTNYRLSADYKVTPRYVGEPQ